MSWSWSWSKKPYYFKDKYCFDEVQRIKKKYPEICEKDINDTSFHHDRTLFGLNSSCDKYKYDDV